MIDSISPAALSTLASVSFAFVLEGIVGEEFAGSASPRPQVCCHRSQLPNQFVSMLIDRRVGDEPARRTFARFDLAYYIISVVHGCNQVVIEGSSLTNRLSVPCPLFILPVISST